MTRGKSFYGPGSAYGTLAGNFLFVLMTNYFPGHDATRAFAMFDAKLVKDEYDELDGLTGSDLDDALEWEARLRGKDLFE